MDHIFRWDIQELSKALKISEADVRLYFTDGRRVSFLMERRIANEFLKGTLASSEGAAYDVIDSQGKKWEVRSISKGGIYFCPSYMVGKGRKFVEKGFIEKIKEIEGFIVCDIESFPKIPIWSITSAQVLQWWYEKKLGTSTKISRKKALELVKTI
jgi:hypothetical protein